MGSSFYTGIVLALSFSMWATILGKTGFSPGLDICRCNPFEISFDKADSLGGILVKVDQNVDPVPEPATMLLLGFGLVGLAGVRRFRK